VVGDASLTLPSAGLLRRLAAIAYDAILLAGLLVLASAVVTIPLGLALGPEQARSLFASPWFKWPFFAYCVLVAGFFHVWFWTHGGQTLGMRAWRLKVVRVDGGSLTARDAIARWLAALVSWLPLGLGFLWPLVDPCRLAWHDRLSGSRLVLLRKAAVAIAAPVSVSDAAAASPPGGTRRPEAPQPPAD